MYFFGLSWRWLVSKRQGSLLHDSVCIDASTPCRIVGKRFAAANTPIMEISVERWHATIKAGTRSAPNTTSAYDSVHGLRKGELTSVFDDSPEEVSKLAYKFDTCSRSARQCLESLGLAAHPAVLPFVCQETGNIPHHVANDVIYRADPTTQLRKLPEFSKPPPPVLPDVSGMSPFGDGNADAGFDDDAGPGTPNQFAADGNHIESPLASPRNSTRNQDGVRPLHRYGDDDEEYSPLSPEVFHPMEGDASPLQAVHDSKPTDAASLDDPFASPLVLEPLSPPKSLVGGVDNGSIHAGGDDEAAGSFRLAPVEVQMEVEARPLDPMDIPRMSFEDQREFVDWFDIGSKTPSPRGYASCSLLRV